VTTDLTPEDGPWRILLVDDDALIVELLTLRLRAAGYVIATAANGEEAYATIKKERPHLVVCDVVMPKVDGPSLCRRVRAEGDTTPFLFLTAKGQPQDIVQVLASGADDYLVKPFQPSELAARLTAVLRRFYPHP
jgi:two-component system OmpR family response regulator